MKYICIENEVLVSFLDYEPNVPESVTVFKISDEEYDLIEGGSHYFDIKNKKIESTSPDLLQEREKQKKSDEALVFLEKTDWMIMRHLREKTLGVPTTLTDSELLELEQSRHEYAKLVI